MKPARLAPAPPIAPGKLPPVILPGATLRTFCSELLQAAGVPLGSAELVAHSLVAANLRGVDSHGVQLLTTYLQQLRSGGVAPAARGHVAFESGACLTYAAANGLGQVTAERCVQEALRLVKGSGLAMVVARHANHFGAAAYWADQIVAAGCIGIVMCNASPAVPPWQGRDVRFGTNPFCAGVPSAGPFPWTLDMATSMVALGKLGDAAFRGESQIPTWWGFLDSDRQPTTSTAAALQGTPSPFGRYKGSGLAMLVEILTAALSGGLMSTELPGFGQGSHPLLLSHAFLVIDPGRFGNASPLGHRVECLTGLVKSSTPAENFGEVLVAGEPEWRVQQERTLHGIPVPQDLWDQLTTAAAGLGVRTQAV